MSKKKKKNKEKRKKQSTKEIIFYKAKEIALLPAVTGPSKK